jgi:hypothetical protein
MDRDSISVQTLGQTGRRGIELVPRYRKLASGLIQCSHMLLLETASGGGGQ